jgi:hypothetical protein
MWDHGMLQLLCNVARLEAGAKPAINEGLAREAISRGLLIKWRNGYVRTRLGKDYLRHALGSGEVSVGARSVGQAMAFA